MKTIRTILLSIATAWTFIAASSAYFPLALILIGGSSFAGNVMNCKVKGGTVDCYIPTRTSPWIIEVAWFGGGDPAGDPGCRGFHNLGTQTADSAIEAYTQAANIINPAFRQACHSNIDIYYPVGTCSHMTHWLQADGRIRVYAAPGPNLSACATSFLSCPEGTEASVNNGLALCMPTTKVFDPKTNGPCPCGTCEGNPIHSGTGNKFQAETDVDVSSGIGFKRYYNSNWLTRARFGYQWTGEFDSFVTIVSGTQYTQAYVNMGNGKQIVFNSQDLSAWKADSDSVDTLIRLVEGGSPNGWRYTDNSVGKIYDYNKEGYLKTVTSLNGYVQTLNYQNNILMSVEDNFGKKLTFNHEKVFHLVSSIVDGSGRTTKYSYNDTGVLSKVTYPDGTSRSYTYINGWRLSGIVDENGSTFATFAYDQNNRAISTEHAGGVERYALSYANDQTTVANPSLTNILKSFVEVNGAPKLSSISQPSGSGCSAASAAKSYDGTTGLLSEESNFSGEKSCYRYNARNLKTDTIEGLPSNFSCDQAFSNLPTGARRSSQEWHPDWALPTIATSSGQKTTNVHHGQTDPFTGTIANCSIVNSMPGGKPTPLLCKSVTQATLADGSLDVSSPIVSEVFTYDPLGRRLTRKDSLNRTTTYAYYADTAMSLVETTIPSFTSFLINADGLEGSTSIVDSSSTPKNIAFLSGNTKISTLQSKFGGSSLALDGSGDYLATSASEDFDFGTGDFTIEWFEFPTFNANQGRFHLRGTALGGTGTGYVTGLAVGYNGTGWSIYHGSTYDGAAATLALDTWTHVALVRTNGVMRLFVAGVQIGPDMNFAGSLPNTGSAVLTIGAYYEANYSLMGYMDDFRIVKGAALYTSAFTPPTISLTSAGGITAGTTVTAVGPNSRGHSKGDLQSVTGPTGLVTAFDVYDPAGRVLRMTDPKGIVTDMSYTPRGLVSTVSVTPPGGVVRTTTYTYDNVGQLTSVANPDGTTVSYSYDAAHRLIGVTDARGNSVTYTLDNMSNRIAEQLKDPSGVLQRTMSRSFDALNRVQQIQLQ